MKIAIHFTPIEYKYGLSRHIPLKCWIFFPIHSLDIGQSLVLNGMQCVHRNCIHSNRLYRSGEDIFNSVLHKQTLWDVIKYMEVYQTTMACRYTWFKGKKSSKFGQEISLIFHCQRLYARLCPHPSLRFSW